jgi:predicted amidohydrolase YtcJ
LLFEEENLGSLSSGKIADFIVLDKDPFKVSLEELKNIKVLMTFVGGELKYKANN